MTPADVFVWTCTITTCCLVVGAGVGLLALGFNALEKEIFK
jgi:hypothetical protein